MKISAKIILAQETTRKPAVEELSEEELERLVQEEEDLPERTPRIQHDYEVYNKPDRLRIVSGDGKLFDVFEMPDGSVALEPITLKVEYHPTKIQKFKSWKEVQEAINELCPDYTPYKAINAKLLRKIISAALDERINPYGKT